MLLRTSPSSTPASALQLTPCPCICPTITDSVPQAHTRYPSLYPRVSYTDGFSNSTNTYFISHLHIRGSPIPLVHSSQIQHSSLFRSCVQARAMPILSSLKTNSARLCLTNKPASPRPACRSVISTARRCSRMGPRKTSQRFSSVKLLV